MSRCVVKQCTATHQGSCSFLLWTNSVNNSTGQGSRTSSCGRTCEMIDAESLKECVCLCIFVFVRMCVVVFVCVFARVKCGRAWHNVLLTFTMCRDIVSSETRNHSPRTAGCDITGRALLLSPWLHFQNGQFRFQLLTSFVLISLRIVSQQSCDPHFCCLNWGYSS